MNDGVEPLFQRIADSMRAKIPEEWTTAQFEAIFHPDGSIYEAEYTRKADGVARSFQPADGGSRAFRELRKLFKEAGRPLWGRACFGLRPDDSFNIEWDYDNCDANGDTLFDEEEELRRYEARRKRLTA